VVRGFDDLKAAATQANARVLVLIFPIFPYREADWEHYAYAGIHQQVAALATREGFDVLDLLPVFSRQKADAVTLPKDNVHPNALGHRLAAAEIAEKVSHMMPRP
jgi:lysophospholipase L1-like esterase